MHIRYCNWVILESSIEKMLLESDNIIESIKLPERTLGLENQRLTYITNFPRKTCIAETQELVLSVNTIPMHTRRATTLVNICGEDYC